jgi:ribosomal protein S18 acetylase RimI-like enzyme
VPGDLTQLSFRAAEPADYDAMVAVVDRWWGRPIAAALQRVFLAHFSATSLVAERARPAEPGRSELAGFLVGFGSPADAEQAYIHFVGVDPAARGTGLGRELYERFFVLMRADGRSVVHAVTSPVNTGSIAFHRAMGFSASEPVVDYDGPGQDRVVFTRALT